MGQSIPENPQDRASAPVKVTTYNKNKPDEIKITGFKDVKSLTGVGTLTTKEIRMSGNLVDGKMNGLGSIMLANGAKLEGNFVNN